MKIHAIDPGLNCTGIATFEAGFLVETGIVNNPLKASDPLISRIRAMIDLLPPCHAGEWPQVYMLGKGKGDANDLLPLAAITGACVTAPEGRIYTPAEWQGQLDKDACHRRIRTRLGPVEARIFDGLSDLGAKAHNARDAVGIGLKYLGRFDRKIVVAR